MREQQLSRAHAKATLVVAILIALMLGLVVLRLAVGLYHDIHPTPTPVHVYVCDNGKCEDRGSV